MKNMRILFSNPVTVIVFYFLLTCAFAYYNLVKGMSEEFIVLKSVGLILWITSLSLYRLHWTELIKNTKRSQSNALSTIFGLIFTMGMYLVTWKPGRYERSDLYIFLIMFVLMSYIQYGQVCREINEKATHEEHH